MFGEEAASLTEVPGETHWPWRHAAQWLALTALLVLPALRAQAVDVSALALFKDRAVLRIDGRQRTLKVGESSPEGVRLLRADASAARVAIDGAEHELSLDGRIQSAFTAAPPPQVVRLVPGDGGHYFVDGQINGNPVSFLVDTGATTVAMNKHFARSIGLRYMVDGTRGAVETASGVVAAYRVLLTEVKIQSLRLGRVEGVVLDSDYPSKPLLGQSFLNRLDIHRAGAVLEIRTR